jgi:hypothetical protein
MPDNSVSSKKPVKALIPIGANYVFHLMAVGRAGFDSDYANRYADTVHADDVRIIEEYRKRLAFGEGSGGDLVGPVVIIPAALEFNSAEAFDEYFSILLSSCQSRDFEPFLKRYDKDMQRFKAWFSISGESLAPMAELAGEIERLRAIFSRNFAAYEERVWPREQKTMQPVGEAIDSFFAQKDYIALWEKEVGISFQAPQYNPVLCSAIENGPNANSLGYDKVVFYHGNPLAKTIHFVSHEIGSHLLVETMLGLCRWGGYDFKVAYAAFECLAKFYNQRILGTEALAYSMSNFPETEYLGIYEALAKADANLSAEQMLARGMDEWLKRHKAESEK